jgi:hypothetical protein
MAESSSLATLQNPSVRSAITRGYLVPWTDCNCVRRNRPSKPKSSAAGGRGSNVTDRRPGAPVEAMRSIITLIHLASSTCSSFPSITIAHKFPKLLCCGLPVDEKSGLCSSTHLTPTMFTRFRTRLPMPDSYHITIRAIPVIFRE